MEEENHRKPKRNRVKLAKPAGELEVHDQLALTSSEKGRGREECIRLGMHDWGCWEFTITVVGKGPQTYRFPQCRRCGCDLFSR